MVEVKGDGQGGLEKAIRLLRKENEKDGLKWHLRRHEYFLTRSEMRRFKNRLSIRRIKRMLSKRKFADV